MLWVHQWKQYYECDDLRNLFWIKFQLQHNLFKEMYPAPKPKHMRSIEFANTGVVSITSRSTLEIGFDGTPIRN